MTLSRFPQCRAFSKAEMDEKSLSPLFLIDCGGGEEGQWLQMTGAQLGVSFCHFSRPMD